MWLWHPRLSFGKCGNCSHGNPLYVCDLLMSRFDFAFVATWYSIFEEQATEIYNNVYQVLEQYLMQTFNDFVQELGGSGPMSLSLPPFPAFLGRPPNSGEVTQMEIPGSSTSGESMGSHVAQSLSLTQEEESFASFTPKGFLLGGCFGSFFL